MLIDLHTHSNCSDGRQSPEELVALAAGAQVRLLALSDHDTVAGISRAQAAGERQGVVILPAVELSTRWHGHSVHLLAYLPAAWRPEGAGGVALQSWLEGVRGKRDERNRGLVERLGTMGIRLDLSVLAEAVGVPVNQVGRPHIARWLVQQGHASSVAEAFDRYLMPGAHTYVRLEGAPAVEAIEQVHACGGRASLAHPVRLKWEWEARFSELLGAGLDAVEVYYPQHDSGLRRQLAELARRHSLLMTGGSDFHGREQDRIGMGYPEAVVQSWVGTLVEALPADRPLASSLGSSSRPRDLPT